MYRILKGIIMLLRGREEGFGWTALLIVGGIILLIGGAIYGAAQAGGAMSTYSRSSHQAEEAFSSPATPQSNEKLDEIQHTHRQGGLPVMTPVLESGIRAQGAGGPQNLGISYTIGRWITSIIDWATGRSSDTSKTAGVDDLGGHTNIQDTTDDSAAAGTGGSSGGSSSGGSSSGGSGGCNDGCVP